MVLRDCVFNPAQPPLISVYWVAERVEDMRTNKKSKAFYELRNNSVYLFLCKLIESAYKGNIEHHYLSQSISKDAVLKLSADGHIKAHETMLVFAPCEYTQEALRLTKMLYDSKILKKKAETYANMSPDKKAEMRAKLSKSKKGQKNPMYGRKGIFAPNYGKVFTDEHRRRISENHADISGENNPNWKKDFSVETRAKLAVASGKLSVNQVVDIFKRVWAGEKQQKLAEEYEVSLSVISRIKARKRWGHITKNIVTANLRF